MHGSDVRQMMDGERVGPSLEEMEKAEKELFTKIKNSKGKAART